jgi:wobble nucleotide-excising tRNase
MLAVGELRAEMRKLTVESFERIAKGLRHSDTGLSIVIVGVTI